MNPTQVPPNGEPVAIQQQVMQAEIDRLRAALQNTENRLHEAEKQRDKYHEFTKLWIQQNCPLSEWDDFDPAEYTIPFDEDYLAEIEARFKP